MLRAKARKWVAIHVAVDVVATCLAWHAAYALRFHEPLAALVPVTKGVPDVSRYLLLLPLIALVWPPVLYFHGLYQIRRGRSLIDETFAILFSVLIASALTLGATLYVRVYYRFQPEVAPLWESSHATLEAGDPEPTAINQYANELLTAFRGSSCNKAQQRYARLDAPPYWTPSLSRDLRIASLEPAEQGLIGTAFLADHSTYERRFAEVYQRMEPFLRRERIGATLTALLDHTVPDHERWSFDAEAEERALAWLTATLEAIPAPAYE